MVLVTVLGVKGSIKKQNSRLNLKICFLYSMIHELGSTPFSKQKGALRSYTKWKIFIGRWRWGKEVILAKNELC